MTGKNFSQSARNVRLVDYSLWAELASIDGRWQYDVVGLALKLPAEREQKFDVKIVEYNADYRFLLSADCLQQDGSYASSFLDLDGYIGNSSGKFKRGVNFTESSQDIRLAGTTLCGRLSQNGRALRESTMDISRIVRCLNGRLIAFNGLRSEDNYPPMPVGSADNVGRLTGCETILVNGSILLASYCATDGVRRQCAFKLRKIFGVAEGRLRPFGHNFAPGLAKNLELSGSVLSMDIEQPSQDFGNRERSTSYEQCSVDLEDYIVLEEGRLKLYKPSSTSRHKVYLDEDQLGFNAVFDLFPKRKLSENWFNPANRWSLASSWIDGCIQDHDNCFKGEALLPTRCLDIGTRPRDRIRVVTTSNVHGRYACLSYCWGKAELNKLTSGTINSYAEEIPRWSLPKMYIDAINVCQYLGIRHLWIDSLCIVQDSKDDWLRESTKMAAYYGHCYICIAATSLTSPDASLGFKDRPTAVISNGKDRHGASYSLFAYPSDCLDNVPHFSRADTATLDEHFPLMRRAWVFQERLLAPRTLHFAGTEILFECAKGLSCECGHAMDSYWMSIGDVGRRMNMEGMEDGAVMKRRAPGSLGWNQYIVAYSYLNLTYVDDRLPAISGLARDYASRRLHRHPGQYLAGLWRNSIYEGLVWFVGAPLLRHRAKKVIRFRNEDEDEAKFWTTQQGRLREYVAPSWSWASIFDAISYRAPEDNRPLCEVIDASIRLAGDDELGAVAKGCSLTIKGRLAESSWTAISDGSSSVPYMLTSLTGSQQMDLDDSPSIRFLPDYTITAPDENQISRTEKLFVLPVLSQNVSLVGWSYDGDHVKMDKERERISRIRNTLCLVLRKSNGRDKKGMACFKRVGFTEYVNVVGAVENIDPNGYREETFVLL
ncbi:hypothetical protein FKW77_003593 [Venturia effusa]|uniref:Cyanovirin-N domain-containing protein n=1 Tax=Venturia effusa TaxID=50376 RepID=A0A517LL68_9PEZI|nr:hypothetical protein FKW77_003593 [Venturia effusa]